MNYYEFNKCNHILNIYINSIYYKNITYIIYVILYISYINQ